MGNKFWQSCVFLKMHTFNLSNTFGHSLTPLKDNFTSWAAHYNWKCFDLWLKCRIFLTWNKWCKMALTFQVDVINIEKVINISQSFTKHVWMFKVSVPILILICWHELTNPLLFPRQNSSPAMWRLGLLAGSKITKLTHWTKQIVWFSKLHITSQPTEKVVAGNQW